MSHFRRAGRIAALVAMLALTAAGEGAAHPHVMIEAEVALEVRAGTLVAIRQRWTFDEAYRTSIYEEFDKNRNGILDPDELRAFQGLARSTMDRFGNFTTIESGKAKARTQRIAFTKVDIASPRPVIEFRLVLRESLGVAPSAVVEIYDPTYYSAFRIPAAKHLSVEADAGAKCAATLTEPSKDGAQLKAYRAFAAEFGPLAARLVKPQSITLACEAIEPSAAVPDDRAPVVDASGR